MPNKINHIAFIMDGNNRWSKKNKLSKFQGYSKGANKLINLTKFIFENTSAKYVSAFALSKNNLKRPNNIVSVLKKVLLDFLDKEIYLNQKNKFNIKFIGNKKFLDKKILTKIDNLEKHNSNFKKTLIIFINYSGIGDINDAANKYIETKQNKKKMSLGDFLLTKNIPDPEILIRSGGYSRLSDFLIYQLTFTELFFLKKLWPDVNNTDLFKIFNKYYKLERKFGL